jgi:hypothetical protein
MIWRTKMSEVSLYVTAHPDDHEMMFGYDSQRQGNEAHALVASSGELGFGDQRTRYLCRQRA